MSNTCPNIEREEKWKNFCLKGEKDSRVHCVLTKNLRKAVNAEQTNHLNPWNTPAKPLIFYSTSQCNLLRLLQDEVLNQTIVLLVDWRARSGWKLEKCKVCYFTLQLQIHHHVAGCSSTSYIQLRQKHLPVLSDTANIPVFPANIPSVSFRKAEGTASDQPSRRFSGIYIILQNALSTFESAELHCSHDPHGGGMLELYKVSSHSLPCLIGPQPEDERLQTQDQGEEHNQYLLLWSKLNQIVLFKHIPFRQPPTYTTETQLKLQINISIQTLLIPFTTPNERPQWNTQ